jgi:hypothetical protein
MQDDARAIAIRCSPDSWSCSELSPAALEAACGTRTMTTAMPILPDSKANLSDPSAIISLWLAQVALPRP